MTCAAGNSETYAMTTPTATWATDRPRTTHDQRISRAASATRHQPEHQQDGAEQRDERRIAVQEVEGADRGQGGIARHAGIERGVHAAAHLRAERDLDQGDENQNDDRRSERGVLEPRGSRQRERRLKPSLAERPRP